MSDSLLLFPRFQILASWLLVKGAEGCSRPVGLDPLGLLSCVVAADSQMQPKLECLDV